MNHFLKISPGLRACLLSAGTLVVCGCSNEDYPTGTDGAAAGEPTEVSLSLSAFRSDSGDGTPSDPSTDAEKINSWWIAFVDHEGKVTKILSREGSTPVEMETFKAIVPAGAYTLYAFANISTEELKTATGLTFAEGAAVSLPSGTSNIDDAVWSTSLNGWDASKPLPMSGFLKNVRVRNSVEENFSIEVARMAAKVEFQFSNPGKEDVTVNGITLDPVTVSSISLFPKGAAGISYAHLGNSAYSPLTGAQYAKQTFSFASGNVVKGEEEKSLSLYIQESLSDRANDEAFTIGMNVTHSDGVSDYEQHNITRDIVSYINRNDHILIPVTLSRYDVDVEGVFYPPIGGYPAAASTTDPEGAQIFTFSSEGDFAIVAHITDKQTGRHLAPVYYTVTLSDLSDPQGIFTANPTVTAGSVSLPDEVNGTLGKNKGKASVSMTVNVYDRPHYETGAQVTGAQVTDSYTRKIYIIRD